LSVLNHDRGARHLTVAVSIDQARSNRDSPTVFAVYFEPARDMSPLPRSNRRQKSAAGAVR